MSTRFPGIGLLSMVGLFVGAAGGYVALKTDVPAPTEVVPAPITIPSADTAAPGLSAPPSGDAVSAPIARPEPEPLTSPVPKSPIRAKVNQTTAESARPTPSANAAESQSASPATTPAPTSVAPASSPVFAPPATIPTTVVAEPDPPVTTPVSTPEAALDELTVAKHSVIGIRLDAPISTRTARVEDRVTATVSRDVTVAGRTAIAAGVRLEGTVVLVERGGRFKTRPRLGLQFDRVILSDGTRVSLKTDTIYRDGDSPTADATARLGTGAVAGAILGGIIGGKKGAVIGSAAGVAGGVATVMHGDGNEASLTGGAPLTVRLTEDVTILIKR